MAPEPYTCLLCGQKFNDFGNNPEPLSSAAGEEFVGRRCCNDCNAIYVVPTRMVKFGFGVPPQPIQIYNEDGQYSGTFITVTQEKKDKEGKKE